jgi:carbohydrate kinase (thermoresistant glucokinase family)
MGVSGSGKSTVGAALARRLGVPFADADTFHPAANVAKMAAGTALDDDDRRPWLDAVGGWLATHDDGVMSCSSLKRRYRDQLRSYRSDVVFLHLTGSPEMIGGRLAGRPGHFMPSSLVMSQFDALEPLDADEHGMAVDVGQGVEAIVEAFVRYLSVSP